MGYDTVVPTDDEKTKMSVLSEKRTGYEWASVRYRAVILKH